MKAPAINSFIRLPRLIDPSFVHDLSSDHDSEAVIRAVVGLGASLGMATTGEGVETREDLDYLRKEGFTEARRHFFSPPRPANQVCKMLIRSIRPQEPLECARPRRRHLQVEGYRIECRDCYKPMTLPTDEFIRRFPTNPSAQGLNQRGWAIGLVQQGRVTKMRRQGQIVAVVGGGENKWDVSFRRDFGENDTRIGLLVKFQVDNDRINPIFVRQQLVGLLEADRSDDIENASFAQHVFDQQSDEEFILDH
jgi:hypothetical protein